MKAKCTGPFDAGGRLVFKGIDGIELEAVGGVQTASLTVLNCTGAMECVPETAFIRGHIIGVVSRANAGLRHNRLRSVGQCTGAL